MSPATLDHLSWPLADTAMPSAQAATAIAPARYSMQRVAAIAAAARASRVAP